MKRFLVFVYEDYYPAGGWNDLINDCDTVEEAKTFIEQKLPGDERFENADIIDTETGEGIKTDLLEAQETGEIKWTVWETSYVVPLYKRYTGEMK